MVASHARRSSNYDPKKMPPYFILDRVRMVPKLCTSDLHILPYVYYY